MALYTYNLYLVRELERGDLFGELVTLGLLSSPESASGEEDRTHVLGRAPGYFRQVENRVHTSCPLQIVALDLDVDPFERLLAKDGRAFLDWFWRVAELSNLAYAFMPGGGDFKYYLRGQSTDEIVFWHLGALVETGTVEIVHPVMYFAERLGEGYRQATRASWPVNESRAGAGCLLMLASVESPTGFEILEPGVIYQDLLRDFCRSEQ